MDELDDLTDEEYYLYMSDPAHWKEHFPGDDNYIPYVFSLDSGFQVRDKLVAYLSQPNLDYQDRARHEHLLRALQCDIRDMKFGHDNERAWHGHRP